jgi:uncharacterized protein YndB with AHSA1/START domain
MMFVRKEITVDAPPELAFAVFTERFDTWWPRSHHIGEPELREAVLERRTGGRWYELGVDGSECEWGEVLAYEPPSRLVLTWRIGADWKYHADQASEIHVTFEPEGERTNVTLEHKHLERHGEGAAQLRDVIATDEGGWDGLLKLYRDAVVSRSSAAELMQ